MKIEVNFDDITVGEWGETLSQTIREEVTMALRALVRAEVKGKKEEWQRQVQRQVRAALNAITTEDIARIAKDAMREDNKKGR